MKSLFLEMDPIIHEEFIQHLTKFPEEIYPIISITEPFLNFLGDTNDDK